MKYPVGTFSNSDTNFSHIHINLVGLLPMCQGYLYLILMTNCCANQGTSANTVSKAILKDEIITFGILQVVTTSHNFKHSSFGNLSQTIAYHLCVNGLIKIFHCSLKTSLTGSTTFFWFFFLQSVKKHPIGRLSSSPAKLIIGIPPSLPGWYFNHSPNACSTLTIPFI